MKKHPMKKHPMKKKLLAMMNDAEQELLRDIFERYLADLHEDDLVDLHTRVRRARNKYSKLYRRRSAAKVQADKGRAKASAANQRTARKAEIFEDALAKVSRQLARAARASAEELKAERLAAAGGAEKPNAGRHPERAGSTALATEKRKRRTGASKRSRAQARAATRRGHAKRAAKH
jgi:hypothetical protein